MSQYPEKKSQSNQFQSTINGKFYDVSPAHVFCLLKCAIDDLHIKVYTRFSILFHKYCFNTREALVAPFVAGIFFNL